jgi:hypothetical protein
MPQRSDNQERTNARHKPGRLENLLSWPQVSQFELLPCLIAGPVFSGRLKTKKPSAPVRSDESSKPEEF